MRMRSRAPASLPLLLGACSWQTYQNMLGSGAAQGRHFQMLFWTFVGVCGVTYLAVIGFLIAAIVHRRRAANVVESGRHHQSHPWMRLGLIWWSALIAVGLSALAIASFLTDRAMARDAAPTPLPITVTANQWWWDMRYDSADPSQVVRTANELHLPAGMPARIVLHSNDVIHSLWIPSLAGKEDVIPGRETVLNVTPERTGLYRGQCAEFCGLQHAKMALVVSVDSPDDFARWRLREAEPAAIPYDSLTFAGYQVVTRGRCASCHTITGTAAHGGKGPDLTHVASRRSIAAGTLPMTKGNLYGWVANAPALKPGTKMPASGLEPEQLHAVVAYLETLK